MDLFEYQAKELFAKHNVPTTPGRVTDTAEGAKAIAEEIGRPVMVKAQVKAGGRGKAGGVKYAATPDDAFTHAQNILGLDIKGHIVKKLLVAEASDIAEEYYISFLLDRSNRTYLAMCSVEGGMEIEEVAATKPERLAKVPVDAVKGVAEGGEVIEEGDGPADVGEVGLIRLRPVGLAGVGGGLEELGEFFVHLLLGLGGHVLDLVDGQIAELRLEGRAGGGLDAADAAHAGRGISGMRRRALAAGVVLRVESGAGGTRVHIDLPDLRGRAS